MNQEATGMGWIDQKIQNLLGRQLAQNDSKQEDFYRNKKIFLLKKRIKVQPNFCCEYYTYKQNY